MEHSKETIKEDKIDMQDYFVCYLDILGYKQFVFNNKNNVKKILEAKNALEAIIDQKNVFQRFEITSLKQIFQSIEINILSDSIIITMPLSNMKMFNLNDVGRSTYYYCLMYLLYVSNVYRIIASRMGHLLRGAIVRGQHLHTNLKDSENVFIFSQALSEAYLIEKKAIYPRIIIDNSLVSFLKQFPMNVDDPFYKQVNELLYIDYTGIRCLDIYSDVVSYLENNTNNTELVFQMQNLCEMVEAQIESNRANPEIMKKLVYFAQTHNNKFSDLKYNQYRIGLNNKTTFRKNNFGNFGTIEDSHTNSVVD